MKAQAVTLILVMVFALAGTTQAQSDVVASTGAESEEDLLAREVDDPTVILTQLKFQDIYTPGNFETSAQTNTAQLQAVVPIVALPFLPFQQVLRPTFKLQTSATSSGSATITEFADTEFFDLFISNWPDPKETGFGWAVGPTFVFPTGRVSQAGKHAWQVGPAAAAAYRGVPHLMVGFLFQNPISFAYTNSSATPQNQMEFQPLVSYTLGRGWYVKSADSTWTVNWRHGSSTTIPISLGFGKVWQFEGPELNTWVSGEWTAYRQYAGITPMYTVRFGLTLLFPRFEL
ncbi:MAG: hypothetical protein ACLQBA_16395 [Candidatus Binataceae bacterium]